MCKGRIGMKYRTRVTEKSKTYEASAPAMSSKTWRIISMVWRTEQLKCDMNGREFIEGVIFNFSSGNKPV